MTPESVTLMELARRVALAHRDLPGAAAAMVTGSVAKGLSDELSDIDMAIYYAGSLPDDETLGAVYAGLGGLNRRPLGGPREEQILIEAFDLNGVEVQIIHATIAGHDATLDELLVHHKVDTPLAKVAEGMLNCVAFYGEAQIGAWKDRAAAFPPALGAAMVKHFLRFFPAWGIPGQLTRRDSTVFYHQVLVESAQNLLGVIAGLNQVYYTPFQLKRMARFIAGLTVAPPDLAARLEALFTLPRTEALDALEALVAETLDLVEALQPEADTGAIRRRIGWRKAPWSLP